jgi:hypothetical protein
VHRVNPYIISVSDFRTCSITDQRSTFTSAPHACVQLDTLQRDHTTQTHFLGAKQRGLFEAQLKPQSRKHFDSASFLPDGGGHGTLAARPPTPLATASRPESPGLLLLVPPLGKPTNVFAGVFHLNLQYPQGELPPFLTLFYAMTASRVFRIE